MIGNSEIAVCAHIGNTKFAMQEQPGTTGATSGGLQVAMHSQLQPFLVDEFIITCNRVSKTCTTYAMARRTMAEIYPFTVDVCVARGVVVPAVFRPLAVRTAIQ